MRKTRFVVYSVLSLFMWWIHTSCDYVYSMLSLFMWWIHTQCDNVYSCRCLCGGYTHNATMSIFVAVYEVDTHIMRQCV